MFTEQVNLSPLLSLLSSWLLAFIRNTCGYLNEFNMLKLAIPVIRGDTLRSALVIRNIARRFMKVDYHR